MLKLSQVTEGKTKLFVPDIKKYKIPEYAPVFYNPKMRKDRDLSVQLLKKYFGKRKTKILDLLSGSGVRAIRYNVECGFDSFANDLNPSAIKLIEKNVKLNKAEVSVSKKDANLFLLEHKNDKFNCIDVDPFGSPASFLGNSFIALKPKKSILCATATDLGALSGTYPKTCFRRYSIVSDRTSFLHELGLRNLIMAMSREANKNDYSIKPLYSYYNLHYYRVFCEISGSTKNINRSLKNIGYISYCPKCERREVFRIFGEIKTGCKCKEKRKILGLTWIGKIGDFDFLKNILNEVFEYQIDELYYDLHSLAKVNKKESIGIQKIIEKIREKGYKAERTHFSGYGVKTTSPFEIVKKIAIK